MRAARTHVSPCVGSSAPQRLSSDTKRDTNSSSGQSHRSTLDWIQGNKGIFQKANENLQEIEEVQEGDFFFPSHSTSIGTGEPNKLKLAFPSSFFEFIEEIWLREETKKY